MVDLSSSTGDTIFVASYLIFCGPNSFRIGLHRVYIYIFGETLTDKVAKVIFDWVASATVFISLNMVLFLVSDAFSGDIALSEEEFKEYKYIEEKMNTSIFELQIEDPKAMQGGSGGIYSKYDKNDFTSGTDSTKSSSKLQKHKDQSRKRKKIRCKKG